MVANGTAPRPAPDVQIRAHAVGLANSSRICERSGGTLSAYNLNPFERAGVKSVALLVPLFE